ncbi:vanadium-dependent haloperoxidase [Protofrankia symbiont of Coriaria ruscifolia]|uniref:vanadium-dependent haloperoxidase n=1 Tax=Protofrankia symbiont of Coriaria ruscifolia TaxID=1306542 RepID=UPI00104184FD|nr:vanadium-dependent haloperoxidase [Protofrankia symbiont of Coriaria ruscifolia]
MTRTSVAPTRASRNRRRVAAVVAALAAVGLAVPAAQAATETDLAVTVAAKPATSNAALVWNSATIAAIESASHSTVTIFPPAAGARALGIQSTCGYDAWAAYDKKAVGPQFDGSLRRPVREHTDASKAAAVSYASYRALVDLFPDQKATFDQVLVGQGYSLPGTTTDPTTPAGVGIAACDAVLSFRHNDGSNQLGSPPYSDTTGYQPVNPPQQIDNFDPSTIVDPNRWTPLVENGQTQQFFTPHFGTVTPFGVASVDPYLPPPAPTYPSAAVTADIDQLLDYSANLTDERKVIAEYWLDRFETPAGHIQRQAQFISARDLHRLNDDVKMFFALNISQADAGIVAWNAKRANDNARPITLIRYDKFGQQIQAWGGPGRGTQTIDGSTWQPYVFTPPFAATVSGHATFAGAGAESLKLFTGSDRFGDSVTIARGSSLIEPGITPATDIRLSWPTFTAAAEENGISRLYSGVHWSYDNGPGQEAGRSVARAGWQRALDYFNGRQP